MKQIQELDHWILLGGSSSLEAGTARAIKLGGREVVIWRSAAGRYHAWEDRCVHRGTRLSLGQVRGDQLVCAYHGWYFGETGQCSFVPAHPESKPASNLCVPAYQSLEDQDLLWVHLGKSEAPPPDFSRQSDAIAYCRSMRFQCEASVLYEAARSWVFLPSGLEQSQGAAASWRYQLTDSKREALTLHWQSGEETGQTVRYHCQEIESASLLIVAEPEEGAVEKRVIAFQPEDRDSTILHFLTDGPRLSCQRWAQRLRWFETTQALEVASHDPRLALADGGAGQ